jgi:hypothetical protein
VIANSAVFGACPYSSPYGCPARRTIRGVKGAYVETSVEPGGVAARSPEWNVPLAAPSRYSCRSGALEWTKSRSALASSADRHSGGVAPANHKGRSSIRRSGASTTEGSRRCGCSFQLLLHPGAPLEASRDSRTV